MDLQAYLHPPTRALACVCAKDARPRDRVAAYPPRSHPFWCAQVRDHCDSPTFFYYYCRESPSLLPNNNIICLGRTKIPRGRIPAPASALRFRIDSRVTHTRTHRRDMETQHFVYSGRPGSVRFSGTEFSLPTCSFIGETKTRDESGGEPS
jgi:hypothetical protein